MMIMMMMMIRNTTSVLSCRCRRVSSKPSRLWRVHGQCYSKQTEQYVVIMYAHILCTVTTTAPITSCSVRHRSPHLNHYDSLRDRRRSPRLNWIFRLLLLRGVRRFKTDVSGLPIGPIFKSLRWIAWPLKMGPIGSLETSVFNQRTPRNNPEDRRIQVRTPYVLFRSLIGVSNSRPLIMSDNLGGLRQILSDVINRDTTTASLHYHFQSVFPCHCVTCASNHGYTVERC